jgi:hypothetical protein
MQPKKAIFLFYTLLLISAGVLIAADQVPTQDKAPMKCCKKYTPNKATSPWNFITEGILHFSV